jgi:signal transduction histidine kinase
MMRKRSAWITSLRRCLLRSRQKSVEAEARFVALTAMSRLATSLVHELKDDIATIQNWVEAVQESAPSNDDVKEACAAIRSAGSVALRRLRRLVITVNRPPARPEIVSVRSVVSQFASSVEGIKVMLSDSEMFVTADPYQIQFVLEELLDNSRRAVHLRGGQATIDVSARVVRHEVLLSWRDNGCGMSAVTRERCFEPFFTTGRSNIGLGLFAARNIVENHGGSITVESRDGEGACFTIILPRHTFAESE